MKLNDLLKMLKSANGKDTKNEGRLYRNSTKKRDYYFQPIENPPISSRFPLNLSIITDQGKNHRPENLNNSPSTSSTTPHNDDQSPRALDSARSALDSARSALDSARSALDSARSVFPSNGSPVDSILINKIKDIGFESLAGAKRYSPVNTVLEVSDFQVENNNVIEEPEKEEETHDDINEISHISSVGNILFFIFIRN